MSSITGTLECSMMDVGRKVWVVGTGFLARLKDDTRGATAIEYGLIAALIAVAIIGAVAAVGDELTNLFNTVESNLADAT